MSKELSARKYMVIVFSTTYCIIMVGLTIALIKKIILPETYIAMGGVFTYVMREISDKYFGRTDRLNQGGDNEKTSTMVKDTIKTTV